MMIVAEQARKSAPGKLARMAPEIGENHILTAGSSAQTHFSWKCRPAIPRQSITEKVA